MLTALVFFQRCQARNLPIVTAMLTVTWMVFMAVVFMQGELVDLIESIGQLGEAVESNLIDASQISPGQRLVVMIGRGLTLTIWVLAFFGGIRRFRHGYWSLSAALLAAAPFGIMLGNSYGGEAIFRVYLFALPFMTFFAAVLIYPSPTSGRSWQTIFSTFFLSVMLFTAFLFAYYGKETMFHFTKKEVEAAEYLYTIAPPGTLLVEGARNYPSQFKNYENFKYVLLSREPEDSQAEILNQPVKVLTRWMSDRQYSAAYVIFTRSQKAEIDLVPESMPKGGLQLIEDALRQSPNFQIIYENEDAVIFTLTDDAKKAGQ
jgi:hypothetical protein